MENFLEKLLSRNEEEDKPLVEGVNIPIIEESWQPDSNMLG